MPAMPDAASEVPLPNFSGGRPVRIASTKFDGSLHYEYDAMLLDQHGSVLRCWIRPGTRWVGYRGEGVLMHPFTMLFFTDGRWYNVMHQHQPTGARGQLTYVNLGAPATFDGTTIRWVDLDLDVLRYEHGVEVHDEDEFAEHSARWAYPDDLVAHLRATTADLVREVEAQTFPFDRERHIPRPLQG
ncbi:MAG: DUF402 domain-containing protein [Dehalococcoidia bacterium]|nr:MAG: DUF402 domain-containing protein [Dehalococcoidia bacterium]